jgi:murein endopeptidase
MKTVLGIVMILSALVLAIAPAFTDCESHGKALTTADGRTVSMKCHWAGVAEVAAAIPLAVAGFYALRSRRRETTRFAAIVGVTSGAMAILLPTLLIGTCGNPTMICNLLMRPALLASGIVAMAASAGLFFVAREPELPAAPAVAA